MTSGSTDNGRRDAIPGTAAFSKFMRVLQAVSDADDPMTIARLAAVTKLPRPTVYRIVAALRAEGMLDEKGDSGLLVPGPRLISLARRSWDRSDLRKAAEGPLARLRDRLDETVHLAVRSGVDMIYVDKLESQQTVRMMSRVGTHVPLHSSSVGKAWLAAMAPEEAAKIVATLPLERRTAHTITSRDLLIEEIAATRRRGYARDLQENELDISCYGRAILDRRGNPAGCISVSMPRYRFESTDQALVTEAMAACVADIARALED